MSQNDFSIANQLAPAFRTDLNAALQALASLSSGSSAPTTTYANMLWYDTGNNILKMRSEANDAWINILYLNQTVNSMYILEDTYVSETSGTIIGRIGNQSDADWEAGASTVNSLVSPERVKLAIEAKRFTSAPQTIASGTQILVTHNFGTIPGIVNFRLRCTTADAGYSAGEDIMVENGMENRVSTPRLTTTQIQVRFSNQTNVFVAAHKSTGALTGLTNSSWNLFVEAFE